MPLLRRNISENEGLFHCTPARPHPVVLDWDDPNMPPEVSAVQDGFNLIVYEHIFALHAHVFELSHVVNRMADVTYNTASFAALIRTLHNLLQLSEVNSPMVLIGYKERDAAERTLWDMIGDIGLSLEKVGERLGAGGASVEVWLARSERTALDGLNSKG